MSLQDLVLRIFRETRTIATVGFSTKPYKPSHAVPRYLLDHGYRVIPVHPSAKEILGQTVYRNLMDIPDQVDLVQLFRPSAEVMPHVEMAIEREVPFLWMQTGIVNEEAAALARKAGMQVVMDRCMMIEHRRFRSRL